MLVRNETASKLRILIGKTLGDLQREILKSKEPLRYADSLCEKVRGWMDAAAKCGVIEMTSNLYKYTFYLQRLNESLKE